MTASVENTTLLPGWLLCRRVAPNTLSSGKIHMIIPEQVTTEGVADIVRASPQFRLKAVGEREPIPAQVKEGDRVVYRGFLRFAQQVGTIFGERSEDLFLLHMDDVLLVVEKDDGPPVQVGHYGEYSV